MKFDISRRSFSESPRYSGVRFLQGRVIVDADLNEQADIQDYRSRRLAEDMIGESGVPVDGENDDAFTLTLTGTALYIEPGRMYVGGLLIQNNARVALTSQEDCGGLANPTTSPMWCAFYVEAFDRPIVVAEDDTFVDPALAATEPSARHKAAWQVKYLEVSGTDLSRAGLDAALEAAFPSSTITMAATMEVGSSSTTPTAYRRPENQLYRVEIHKAVATNNGYQYKWSRENGSTFLPVLEVGTWAAATVGFECELSLESTGPDTDRGLAVGSIVEYITAENLKSATREGSVGILGKVLSITDRTVIIHTAAAGSTSPRVWLRKWDGDWDGPGEDWPYAFDSTTTATYFPIEEGIRVHFGYSGSPLLQLGDYWYIVARTATNGVLEDEVARLPDGPVSRRSLIGAMQYKSTGWDTTTYVDLRRLIRPASQARFDLASGDGQVSLPAQWLLKQAVVDIGISGEEVTFTADSTGQLSSASARPAGATTGATSVSVVTGSDGLAAVWWRLPTDVERTTRQTFLTATYGGRSRTFTASFPSDYDWWITDFRIAVNGGAYGAHNTTEPVVLAAYTLDKVTVTVRYFAHNGSTDDWVWNVGPSARVRIEQVPPGPNITPACTFTVTGPTGGETDRTVTVEFTPGPPKNQAGRWVFELRPARVVGTSIVPPPVIAVTVWHQ